MEGVAAVLTALGFAAHRHRDQRRKGVDASPFINHPIEVTELLASVGGVTDPVTLQAAVLHDTLEDTETTAEELERRFGTVVRRVVEEVTDDKRLPKEERKRLQVLHAPGLSERARLVKIADKIANVRAIAHSPPAGWTLQRRREYLHWSERVIAGCRGCSGPLEALFDRVLAEGHAVLDAEQGSRHRDPRRPGADA
jgi:(p)ppGpp synthase/HD superfamily hydrolase